jgi:glycosyltransferase involved in cell wall biosynthesis
MPTPLTILNVAYPLAPVGPDAVGGAEQILTAIDRALVDAGHRSLVIACAGSTTAGTLLAVPREGGVLDDAARQRAFAAHRVAISAALEQFPIDLVHLHGIDFASYLPEHAPTLVTLHLPLDWYDAALFREPRPRLWFHGVSEAQHRTAPHGATLMPPIPNGVDTARLEAHHAKRCFALNLGRICAEKGVHLALDAAKRAGRPLLIGGEVFRYDAHRRYFDEEVAPRLDHLRRYLGPLGFRRKRRLLAGARCLLVPSLAAETSSLVTMEALACGTPVIAFPRGAIPEIVEHGRTGFLVRDVAEMAEAIEAAGTIDPEACRAAARARHGIEVMNRRYLDLYHSLARRTARPEAA